MGAERHLLSCLMIFTRSVMWWYSRHKQAAVSRLHCVSTYIQLLPLACRAVCMYVHTCYSMFYGVFLDRTSNSLVWMLCSLNEWESDIFDLHWSNSELPTFLQPSLQWNSMHIMYALDRDDWELIMAPPLRHVIVQSCLLLFTYGGLAPIQPLLSLVQYVVMWSPG